MKDENLSEQEQGLAEAAGMDAAAVDPEVAEKINEQIRQAQEALQNDEIAQRIRALGMSLVRGIANLDKNEGREKERSEDDSLIQIMVCSLDVLDLYLHDQREIAKSLHLIGQSLQQHSVLLERLASPPMSISPYKGRLPYHVRDAVTRYEDAAKLGEVQREGETFGDYYERSAAEADEQAMKETAQDAQSD